MMNFRQIPARDVRPGALLMIETPEDRTVLAVRDVVEKFGTMHFVLADRDFAAFYGRADMVWVAQREV